MTDRIRCDSSIAVGETAAVSAASVDIDAFPEPAAGDAVHYDKGFSQPKPEVASAQHQSAVLLTFGGFRASLMMNHTARLTRRGRLRMVKTADEISKIQAVYARCQYLGTRNLTVSFETTPAIVRALLPPPLEPVPEPLGSAWVGDVSNSNAVGPFRGA